MRPFLFWGAVRRTLPLLVLASLFGAGCTTFRGVPSHGGGKRFDEEQRIIAASMREALREMDLAPLKGKKVRVVLTHMTTVGSGNATWGGLQDIGVNWSRFNVDSDYIRYNPSVWNYNIDSVEDRTAVSLRYRPYMGYFTSNVNTDPDTRYFGALLEMKLRHMGAVPVGDKPDVTLHVLLDALGTNRSRVDYILAARDIYRATCEVSYYAEEKNGQLSIKETQAAGEATYDELTVLFFGVDWVRRRSTVLEPPLLVPLNGCEYEGRIREIEVDLSRAMLDGREPPAQLKEEYVDLLGARARLLLESGQPADVRDAENALNRMRSLDPGSRALLNIETEYKDTLNR